MPLVDKSGSGRSILTQIIIILIRMDGVLKAHSSLIQTERYGFEVKALGS